MTVDTLEPSLRNIRKWYAAKLNQQYDTRQRDVAVNISVTDLHAQAAALLASVQANDDVIEGEWSDAEDDV